MVEKWRRVPGFGDYEVSNLGRVWARPRIGVDGRRCGNRMLAVTKVSGYDAVNLAKSKGARCHYIHLLVLTAFRGPCPDGMEARHLDGDRSNAKLSNLRWATHLVNVGDMERHGTKIIGQDRTQAKLNDRKVREIRHLRRRGWKYKELAHKFGVCQSLICGVARGNAWSHV